MTKRKRTPSPSPATRAQPPFQIPPSLQRLSMISRSLAHQSDKLAGGNLDAHNARISGQAQALGDAAPSVVAATEPRDARGRGFRAFAPPKQPTFPLAQTWVAPKPRWAQASVEAGFMPSTQPLFPQGQAWPQPQPRKVIPQPHPQTETMATPVPSCVPPSAPPLVQPEAAIANLEAPPADGETLCLETQPNRIAALIAQKRAANEANRRREAWTRQAAAHRISSQAPDDQLLNELNSALGQPSTANKAARKHASRRPPQYVTPTTPITFDPVVPPNDSQADNQTVAQTRKASVGTTEPAPGQTSAPRAISTENASSHDHDSLFSSSGSPSPSPLEPRKPDGDQAQHSGKQQQNRQDSMVPQLSAAASAAPRVGPIVVQSTSTISKNRFNSRDPDRSSIRQPPQNNHAKPAAAGYYRFDPRHWQTSSMSQQQQPIQPFAPAVPSTYQRAEAGAWPASHDVPQRIPSNPVFRNLTQDKFGRFGVGGKLKETVGQQSGAGVS